MRPTKEVRIGTKTDCTHGETVKFVTKIGKASIYAGSVLDFKSELYRIDRPTIAAIMCRNSIDLSVKDPTFSSDGLKAILKRTVNAQKAASFGYVLVDWDDGRAPPVSTNWFSAFTKDIAEFDGDVVICCFGGHGRTGTALAAILHESGKFGKTDVVKWLRENYCKASVETATQLEWLINSVGVETSEKPTSASYAYTTGVYSTDAIEGGAKRPGTGDLCDSCGKIKYEIMTESTLAYCYDCYTIKSEKALPSERVYNRYCDDCAILHPSGSAYYKEPDVWLCDGCFDKRRNFVAPKELYDDDYGD